LTIEDYVDILHILVSFHEDLLIHY